MNHSNSFYSESAPPMLDVDDEIDKYREQTKQIEEIKQTESKISE